MGILREIIYWGLPILASLYVCGKLYPKLNPPNAKGRIGVIYLLACVASTAGIFLVNAFMWVTIGFIAVITA